MAEQVNNHSQHKGTKGQRSRSEDDGPVGEPRLDAGKKRPRLAVVGARSRGSLELAFVGVNFCALGGGADAACARIGVTDTVDLVFANMFVSTRTLVVEEFG